MSEEELRRRASSFGGVADSYERARPGYPRDAVTWLAGAARRVVDLGAGTGKLTRELTALGYDVVAVEPSPEMADRLRAAAPGAVALEGSAEAIPLPDAAADAVLAAQAYHWFDELVALPEIARVLRPGGTLGLVWNFFDDAEPWLVRLSAITDAEPIPRPEPEPELEASGLFGEVEGATFRHRQPVDRTSLVELVSSRSLLATSEPAERERILAAVAALYDETAGAGGLEISYVAYCFRTRRL